VRDATLTGPTPPTDIRGSEPTPPIYIRGGATPPSRAREGGPKGIVASTRKHRRSLPPAEIRGGKIPISYILYPISYILYKGILLRYRNLFEYERTIPLGDRRSPPSGG
jgi:hypothetical protein